MIAVYKGKAYELGHGAVKLAAIKEEHLPHFVKWLTDPEVTRYMAQDFLGLDMQKELAWFRKHSKTQNEVIFGIFYEDRIIGSAALKNINVKNASAEYGIIIGDIGCWGKGIGTETANLMLHFGFRDMGLHSIKLFADEENKAGTRSYEKAGFKKAGVLRQARRHDKGYSDTIVMDIIEGEWKG